jgi:hypothetical protein
VNLFQFSSILTSLGGAAGVGLALASQGGFWMAVGIVGGFVGGWYAGPLLVLSFFVVGIAFQEGPRSALAFLRRRGR